MKNAYIFVPADLTLPCTFVYFDDQNIDCSQFNAEVYKLIGCDCYESVSIYSDLVMLVDECGKLKDKPVNARASAFYLGTLYGDPIVGDVLICGLCDFDFCSIGPIYSALLADRLHIKLPD